MLSVKEYRDAFVKHLKKTIVLKEPRGLYEPVSYILETGGKRLRPVLTLMVTDIFDTKYKTALNAAMAVELFHNFTLIHDDIMDRASLRRGHKTIHEKWNLNTGILSGDVTMVMAYQFLESYPQKTFGELSALLNKTAIKVCEGQQYDIDFETRDDVTVNEYLKMIEYKTAVLLGAAMEMGAIVAGAPQKQAAAIAHFGLNLGIAFQLKDDYLDTFGDETTFGKKIGGDITENKKTFLYLKAIEGPDNEISKQLQQHYSGSLKSTTEKIEAVKKLFLQSRADLHTRIEIEKYTQRALGFLNDLKIDNKKKKALQHFAEELMNRTV